ncbi:unnamed protein product [Schistosoma turkestanicum]|nr:unnamed protein product [Schistosoma turkestanicum]
MKNISTTTPDKSPTIKQSHVTFETSDLGKTIHRINALPINIQDHGDHWKRITNLAEQSNLPMTMYKPTKRRSSELSGTSGKYDSQQSSKTRASYSSGKTMKESNKLIEETEEQEAKYNIFDRYTEFGGIKSQEREKPKENESERDIQFSRKLDQTKLILHTNHSIRKQLLNIKDHPKSQTFPDRQLYIYVIADPTDMRIELTNLRMYVWPYLQRICNERGFTLNIIDDTMDTDIEPRNQLITPQMMTTTPTPTPTAASNDLTDDYEFKEHLSRRIKQKNFLNCLILLSNRSVGPIVQLPKYLPNSLIKQIKHYALEEIEEIKSEITRLSEKLPGFDSPRLQRRLSKYLSSQTSLGSLPEEVTIKQPNLSPVSDVTSSKRTISKISNITPIQMTQIEDAIRQKSEIIRTLNPDILDKWYRPIPNSQLNISYLQSVSHILPGIICFDDQNIRQAELKSWLNDSHRIRCLLMRFANRDHQITASSNTTYRLSDMEITTPNTETIHSRNDSMPPNSSRPTDMSEKLSNDVEEKYATFQSEIERKIEMILENDELNSDCFVHIRHHQQHDSKRSQLKHSSNENENSISTTDWWRSRSMSLVSWSTIRSVVNTTSPFSSSTLNSMKNEFLSNAFDVSLTRAKLLVNWARLKVPANNQFYYELEKSALITLNDQIHCTQSYLDPINFQEHSIYLNDMCRNLRNKFSQSLINEMNRRDLIDMENLNNFHHHHNKNKNKGKIVNSAYQWCLEFEITAHLEMMERLSSLCIAREETLTQLYDLIYKHTVNCQTKSDANTDYFKFIHITGESGSGKSVLLACLTKMLSTKSMKVNDDSLVNPRVIYRMIGSSTMSLNLLNFLGYLCFELSTQMNDSNIADTYDGLRTAFQTAIIEASYEQSSQQPLIIILDGIENLEECKQRKNDFPISWIPFHWITYKSILNCPVVFILSSINNPNEIAYFNKLIENKIHRILPLNNHNNNENYQQISLTHLDFSSIEKCIKIWSPQNDHDDNLLTLLKSTNTLLQPLQLKIVVQLFNYAQNELHHMFTTTNNTDSNKLTNDQFYSLLLKYAEKFYGTKRVQLILGHLTLTRWGLTDEDLLNLFWCGLLHFNQMTKSIRPLHHQHQHQPHSNYQRHSIQDIDKDLLLLSVFNDKTDRVYITRHWFYRFLYEFLYPLGMLHNTTRSPPYGCYQLWNISQQSFRLWLEHYHLNHSMKIELHTLQVNTFYNQHKITSICQTLTNWHPQQYYIHWRWCYEVPYHLSKLKQIKQLKTICFLNPLWLNMKLQLNAFTDLHESFSLQNILDEFGACLFIVQCCSIDQLKQKQPPKNLQLKTDQPGPPTELFTQHIITCLENNPDITMILGIFIQWRDKLTRNPNLLNSILLNSFKDIDNVQWFNEDDLNIEQNQSQLINTLDKNSLIQKSLNYLLDNIKKYNLLRNIQIPTMMNFKLPHNLCTTNQIVNNLTCKYYGIMLSNTGITCSQKTIQINAIAYSKSKCYIAITAKNLVNLNNTLEIWNIEHDFRQFFVYLACDTIQTIDQLIWITSNDDAILGIESPSQRVVIWPLNLNKSDSRTLLCNQYYVLSDDMHNPLDVGLCKVRETCTVHIVENEHHTIAYIIILQQGIYKLSIWLWEPNSSSHSIKQIFGPISLIHPSNQIIGNQYSYKPDQRIQQRSMSLPNPVKSSTTELFLTGNIYQNIQLYIVCGVRGESHAVMFSIHLNKQPMLNYEFDLSQTPIETKLLQCPNQGTRLLGVHSELGRPIILVSRSPSNNVVAHENVVIGCIDLFDEGTGEFIQRIESNADDNIFIPMEPCSRIFDLLTYAPLPKLYMYYEFANNHFITMIQNYSKRSKCKFSHQYPYNTTNYENISSSMEIVMWDLNQSLAYSIKPAQLIPYIIDNHCTFIAPYTISIRNLNQISMVKPIFEESGYRLYNGDSMINNIHANDAFNLKSISLQNQNTPKMISSIYIIEDLYGDYASFISYHHENNEIFIGIMSFSMYNNDPIDKSDHDDDWSIQYLLVKPFNNNKVDSWSTKDQFVFNGHLLITLEKLEYSVVVEECK